MRRRPPRNGAVFPSLTLIFGRRRGQLLFGRRRGRLLRGFASRARKHLPPKKTEGVSLKKRRRPCFSVPREGACTCYLHSRRSQGCISRCNQKQREGANPMTEKTLTKAELKH